MSREKNWKRRVQHASNRTVSAIMREMDTLQVDRMRSIGLPSPSRFQTMFTYGVFEPWGA